MMNQRNCTTTRASSSRALSLILGGAVITALGGCATDRSASQGPLPGTHIAEYRQIVTDSQRAVKEALHSLDQVSAQTKSCPRPAVDQLAKEVCRLEVDSLKARAHAQAMVARGDAYFEQWHDDLANIKDAEVRALAEQRRPLLQQSFARVKQLSQQTREAFRPFQSHLRKVRNILETDPAATGSESHPRPDSSHPKPRPAGGAGSGRPPRRIEHNRRSRKAAQNPSQELT